MTTSRKICGAILVLAGVAYGLDHYWLQAGTPTVAEAPQPVPSSRSLQAGGLKNIPGSHAMSNGADKPGRSLAARLAATARAEQLDSAAGGGELVTPDAFKPSSLWFPASVAVAVKTAPAPAVPPERIAEFRSHHRLTAVMKSSGGVLAIIGGKVYVPGQQIADGFSVRSIDERGAVVVGNGVTLDLPIEQPGALTSLSPTQ